ncbi:hypothetical protein DL764_002714 [Monosporascus ibericus]|uniref:NmrA-like domain-containing protein n=1 Tax=Monosporascus ibericus TaxID=155417 RepID=A0A4V1XBR0_9PEZI|nr:hypothetical protein DL764_002714 [Monosporascus ibericus]
MAPVIKNVALTGITGNVGAPALKALVESGFNVTVLARKQPDKLPAGVVVKMVDFGSVESLTKVLEGQDALVDTTNTPGSIEVAQHLIDAAVAAGVYRVIPSEFSGDPNNAPLRALPPFVTKTQVLNHLEKKTAGTGTTWTTISNNAFLDWAMRLGFLNIDLKNRKVTRMYDGNHSFEWTLLETVAKAIVGVLKKPRETENRHCFIHSIKKSQNQMVELAKEAIGGEWQVEQGDAKKAYEDAMASLQSGKVDFQVIGDIIRYGVVTPVIGKQFPTNNNKLLGVPTMSDNEVKELLKQIASE